VPRRLAATAALAIAWLLLAAAALAASPSPGLVSRVLPILLTPDKQITDVYGKQLKQIPVTPGETVMFAISNIAGDDNNFYIGTAEQLDSNQVEGLPGLPTFSAGTRQFSWTVPSDVSGLQFASTVPGHYASQHGDFVLKAETPTEGGLEDVPEPGPPYPPPVDGQYVYDYAGILSPRTEAAVQNQIQAIRARTAAQIAVYTQTKPGATTESTVADANALIDQWGIGRKGFDDGLAILFNMDESGCHGQVQLYAGPGFEATFLSNAERQAIFDNDMVPRLRECDMDGALTAAMAKVDAAATPEHAQQLQVARQLNAAVGLVGGPLAFLVLVGAAGRAWLKYGKDPVYLDDPSILMPAPPPGLTAASGAVVWEGQATRRTLTVGLLDLASRGEFVFEPEDRLIGRDKMGIGLLAQPPDDPYVVRNRRRPLSSAEDYLLTHVQALGAGNPTSTISSTELQQLAPKVPTYLDELERHVSDKGWFREPPKKAIARWSGIGVAAIVIGFILAVWLANFIPMSGLLLLGIGLIAGGVATLIISRYMPARTMSGAMIYAMLAAYRRTLQKTMAMSRSMVDVVNNAKLDWLDTPDQAVVWGVALGLNSEVEDVLKRTAEDAQAGVTANVWLPGWYGGPSYAYSTGALGGQSGLAPGLFSSSGIPDFGGMTAALGTIGVAPSSSGSGSGGFGGGGGGGGGGGAGGGF
jgi:uncharacterized membrane protein YgcG